MSQVTENRVNGPNASPDVGPSATSAEAPVVVTIRQTPTGYTAEMADIPGVFGALDFEALLEVIRENYWNFGFAPQTPEGRAAEDADDRAAIDAAKADAEENGTIPWDEVRAELGL